MSETNKKLILDEFNRLKGQQVIGDSGKVVRLIAIGYDYEDYYYVLWNGSKTVWSSCVGTVVQLKSKIDDKQYQRLVYLDSINNFDQITSFWYRDREDAEELVLKFRKEVEILTGKDTFLTEVCWDLN